MIDKKVVKFLFVGILNTLFGYIFFSVIFYLLGQKELSLTLTFIVSVLFNYHTISSYVFQSSHSANKLVIFVSIYILLYVINLIHLWITVDVYGLNVYCSQFSTLFYLPILSYKLNEKYVFIKP